MKSLRFSEVGKTDFFFEMEYKAGDVAENVTDQTARVLYFRKFYMSESCVQVQHGIIIKKF